MALKDNCSQKEKKIRKDKGEELLGPQARLRITPIA